MRYHRHGLIARQLFALLLVVMLGSMLPPAHLAALPASGAQGSAPAVAAPVSLPKITVPSGVPPAGADQLSYLPLMLVNAPLLASEIVLQPGTGGTIGAADGAVRATFAPQAVTQAAHVSFRTLTRPTIDDASLAVGGPAFSINAQATSDGAAITQFPHAVEIVPATAGSPATAIITPSITIAVRYSDADAWGLDLRTFALYTRETNADAWERLPTAVDRDRRLLVATVDHLSQFVPLAALAADAPPADNKRLALDPDDDVGHAAWPGVGTVTELPYNLRLAQEVRQRFTNDKCRVDILITRDSAGQRFVPLADRVSSATNFGADTYTTLAFNALTGAPWGVSVDGGVRGWARSGHPDDDALVTEFFSRVGEYTGRPHTLGVQHPYPNAFYAPVDSLPASTTYAHIETLFLDHNYDWPVINTAFSRVVDAAYAALRTRLEAAGMTCGDDPLHPPPLPAPPSAAELQRLRDLGYQNYQRYGADPVSFSTGNHVLQAHLARLPGRGGLDIDLTLTYNAQDGRDDLFGFGWSFPYNARAIHYSDDSVSVVLHDGRTYHYTWNGGGYDAPAGVYERLEKTAEGWRWTTPGETVLTFQETVGGLGVLTAWQERRGNALHFSYDLSGQDAWQQGNAVPRPPLTQIQDDAGRTVSFLHDGTSHITGLTLPDGRTFGFSYSNGDLTAITDANGGTRRYAYDGRHRITHEWDPEDIHFLENRYDDRDRVIGQTDPDGVQNTIAYDPIARVTTFTDNGGHATRYSYDELNRVTVEQDPLGATVRTTYDANYNVISRVEPRGFETRFTYDSQGNLTSRADPVDSFSSAFYQHDLTTWTYDAHNQVTSMTNALGATWRYEYDAQGNLLRTIAPDGGTTSATYDAYGQVLTLTDANGHTTSYTYDSPGNRVTATDAAGQVTRSTYDAAGREIGYTDANGHAVTFQYDGNSNITRIADPKGQASTFVYDRNDVLIRATDRRSGERQYEYDNNLKLIGERDGLGQWTRYAYDALYRRVAATDPLGRQTHYAYDAAGRLTSVTDPTGAIVRYTYDAAGNLATVTDPLGQRTTMVYDAVGRLKFATDAAGARTEYCYDSEDRLIRTIGPRGEVTDYGYDALDRLVTVKDALGNITRYVYDSAGNRTATIDPLGHRTDTTYDALDRPVSVAQPALPGGARPTAHVAYDAVGNPVALTSPRGFVTTMAYDANDKLTHITDPLGATTAYTYNAEDAVTAVTDPLGHTTATAYDLNGQPTQVTDALGHATVLEYDAAGRLTRMTDALGQATTYAYDAMGRLISATDPLGNTTRYTRDAAGRVTATTDANDHTTRYAYDPVGRLLGVTDPLTGTTGYTYDLAGNLSTITDANGHTTRFDYNFLNQLVQETNPLSNTWRYAYDGAGHMTRRVDAMWRATFYTYDSNGRLIEVVYDGAPAQHPISYTYDLEGNQTGMCDGLGCARQTYDALSRLTSATDWSGRTITRTYDLAGNLTGLTYPNGQTVAYSYDAANQLVGMTDPRGDALVYQRNALGQVTRITRPNSTVSTFSYDAAGRLTGLDNRVLGAPQPQSAYAYALDKVGNRVQVTETRAAFDGSPALVTLTHDYEYDALNRLIRAATNNPASSTGYTFDAVGNRLDLSGSALAPDAGLPALPVAPRPAGAASQYNAANQLMRIEEAGTITTLNYNANGDRVRETQVQTDGVTLRTDYAYDREDRLIGVTKTLSDTSGMTVTLRTWYAYDGYGRRATKTVSATGALTPTEVLTYTYDGVDLVGARLQAGGIISETNYFLAPSPLTGLRRPVELERLPNAATGFAGDRHWYQNDGLDSVIALTGESGNLVSPFLYDEYGRHLAGATDLQVFSYTSQDYDAETGLLHFYARYYDPARGVWLTQDTYRGEIGEPGSLHRYGYVGGNPITLLDVLGYCWEHFGWVCDAGNWLKDTTVEFGGAVVRAIAPPAYAPGIEEGERIEDLVQEHQEQKERDKDNFINKWLIPAVDIFDNIYKFADHGDVGAGAQAVFDAALTRGIIKDVWNIGVRGLRRYFVKETEQVIIKETEKIAVKKITSLTIEEIGEEGVTVYRSVNAGEVQYIGITNDFNRRAAEHLTNKGIQIEKIPGLVNLSRSDARAAEQALIEYYGLGKDGGSLLNKINSIAKTNPEYADQLRRGQDLLKEAGYPGF